MKTLNSFLLEARKNNIKVHFEPAGKQPPHTTFGSWQVSDSGSFSRTYYDMKLGHAIRLANQEYFRIRPDGDLTIIKI